MEIIRRINWVDVLVIILMFRMSYVAFQDGLSHQIFPVFSAVAIIVIGLYYYEKIGGFISQNLLNMPIEISNFLSFLVLAVVAGLVVKFLKSILDKLIKVEWHPILERLGGLVVGIIKASLVTSIVLMTIVLMPLPYLQWSVRERSLVGMHFLKVGPNVYEKASKFLPTIKVEGTKVTKEVVLESLVSDKSIAPKAKREKKKPEWEM